MGPFDKDCPRCQVQGVTPKTGTSVSPPVLPASPQPTNVANWHYSTAGLKIINGLTLLFVTFQSSASALDKDHVSLPIEGRRTNTLSFQNTKTQFTIKRWITDAQRIDLGLIAGEKEKEWHIFQFSPLFPGRMIIEQKADVDKKTGVATIIAGSDSVPLLQGKFEVVNALGNKISQREGNYQIKASPSITRLRSMGRSNLSYERANPLIVGGFAIALLNEAREKYDDNQFSPVYAIPGQWVDVIDNKTGLDEPYSLKSLNPFSAFAAARKILGNTDLISKKQELEDLIQDVVEEKGLRKAVLISMMVTTENSRPPQREEKEGKTTASDHQASQLLKEISIEETALVLLALQVSGVSRTNDYFTKDPIPGLGASLLRGIAQKSRITPDKSQELESLLKAFTLEPRIEKAQIPPQEK